jgi:hypothetical protein
VTARRGEVWRVNLDLYILNSRRQFIADHSSTNYLFYAAKPIKAASRSVVSSLSSHVDVGSRTAEITYHGDFADLGDERRKKFLAHFALADCYGASVDHITGIINQ